LQNRRACFGVHGFRSIETSASAGVQVNESLYNQVFQTYDIYSRCVNY
jgi:hypothetical protein